MPIALIKRISLILRILLTRAGDPAARQNDMKLQFDSVITH